jgi:hypothetical protein
MPVRFIASIGWQSGCQCTICLLATTDQRRGGGQLCECPENLPGVEPGACDRASRAWVVGWGPRARLITDLEDQ